MLKSQVSGKRSSQSKLVVWGLMVVLLTCVFSSAKGACVSKSVAESRIRAVLADAVSVKLTLSLGTADAVGQDLSKNEVRVAIDTAIADRSVLLKAEPWIKDCDYQALVTSVGGKLSSRFDNKAISLSKGYYASVSDAVVGYFAAINQAESASKEETQGGNYNDLSSYRLLIGGSFVHTDEGGATKGKLTSSMMVRTRFWDDRGKIDSDSMQVPERSFIDMIVDAQFFTNKAFNKISFADNDSIASVLLESATSSELSMALFLYYEGWTGFHFDDGGIAGPFLRFSLSTAEGSNDIFRRFIFGYRIENRSSFSTKGMSAEVGFTVDKAPGSLDLKSVKLFGADRIVLNLELPLGATATNRGLFAGFHGEWPIGRKFRHVLIGGNEGPLKSPPIYEFRIGATFDPVKILGPIFQ